MISKKTKLVIFLAVLFGLKLLPCNKVQTSTPPKTNMEPENAHLEKEKHRPKPSILGVPAVSFRGNYT